MDDTGGQMVSQRLIISLILAAYKLLTPSQFFLLPINFWRQAKNNFCAHHIRDDTKGQMVSQRQIVAISLKSDFSIW